MSAPMANSLQTVAVLQMIVQDPRRRRFFALPLTWCARYRFGTRECSRGVPDPQFLLTFLLKYKEKPITWKASSSSHKFSQLHVTMSCDKLYPTVNHNLQKIHQNLFAYPETTCRSNVATLPALKTPKILHLPVPFTLKILDNLPESGIAILAV